MPPGPTLRRQSLARVLAPRAAAALLAAAFAAPLDALAPQEPPPSASEEVIQLEPSAAGEVSARLEKARALAREGRNVAAVAQLQTVRSLPGGDTAEVALELAHVYHALADFGAMTKAARRAIELSDQPEQLAGAHNVLAIALVENPARQQADLEAAKESLLRAIELTRGEAAAPRLTLAQVLLALGDTGQALAEARLAARSENAPPRVRDQAHVAICRWQRSPAAPGGAGVATEAAKPSSSSGGATPAAEPLRVQGDVRAPELIEHVEPVYTDPARAAGTEGTVILEAVVDADGCVAGVKALKTLPMGLTEQAIDAVKSWVFRPATLNGEPVSVYFNLSVRFVVG